MPGDDQQHLYSYLSPEQRLPANHPLRPIRAMTDEALRCLSPKFEALYATTMLYSVRSERLLMEQLQYNLVFRWFVGLDMDDPVWARTTFSKNRDRQLGGDIARPFLKTSSRKQEASGCCRTSSLRSMAPCGKRGPGRRVSAARASAQARLMIPAIGRWIFMATGG
jgi:hypothetical protein